MKHLLFSIVMLLCSVGAFAQVDVAVESVSVTPSSGYKGESFFVNTIVSNVGTVDVTDYIVDYYVSKSSSFNMNNATHVGTSFGSSLSVGNKVSQSFIFIFPTNLSNPSSTTWYVWAKITNRGIIESQDKETNNTKAGTVMIYGSSN